MRSVENAGCGKCGVGKMRGVENAGCGKCGVWKMRSVENAGCGKCGVWKMRRKFQFSVSLCHSNVDKQCVNDKKKNKKTKKRDALLHFKMRKVGMVVAVVEICTRTPLCCRPCFLKEFRSIVN